MAEKRKKRRLPSPEDGDALYTEPDMSAVLTAADLRARMKPREANLMAATDIDKDDINGELADVAANFAYWKELELEARESVRRARVHRDADLGRLNDRLRAEIEEETGKKATEKAIDAAMSQTGEYERIQTVFAIAEREYNRISAVVEAIRMKADTLRSLSANHRAEFMALNATE